MEKASKSLKAELIYGFVTLKTLSIHDNKQTDALPTVKEHCDSLFNPVSMS